MIWDFFRKKRRFLVKCPKCGAHQIEIEGFVSTICSACGYGFAEEDAHRQIFKNLNGKNGENHREDILVHCYRCGTEHLVPHNSTKTQCPNCGAIISLVDRVITSPTSEVIDIRADLWIEFNGSLFSPMAICRNAEIEGRFAGILICEGRLHWFGSGNYPAQFRAQEVLVASDAKISCPHTIQAGRMIVRGLLEANVAVNGTLHILKKAILRGDVVAKSIQVDSGGVLEGNMKICKRPWDPTKFLNLEKKLPLLAPRVRPSYSQRAKVV